MPTREYRIESTYMGITVVNFVYTSRRSDSLIECLKEHGHTSIRVTIREFIS